MEVEATYHNGTLKLKDALPLEEGQTVWVSVREEADLDRVVAMHRAADEWLARQAPIPEPPQFSPEEWAKLDAEFDELLAEIRAVSGEYTEADIAADVDEALEAVRRERRRQLSK
jgi:predicted DNA-binding antitoxin AbrB/MazE fold protein